MVCQTVLEGHVREGEGVELHSTLDIVHKSRISHCIVYTCVNGIFYILNHNPSLVLYIVYILRVRVYIRVLYIPLRIYTN
jgi:hypothetical protein